jgi:hypothetical protein
VTGQRLGENTRIGQITLRADCVDVHERELAASYQRARCPFHAPHFCSNFSRFAAKRRS